MTAWLAKHRDALLMVAGFVALEVLLSSMVTANHTFGNVRWYFAVVGEMKTHGGPFGVWTPYPPLFGTTLYALGSITHTWQSFLLSWEVLNASLLLGAVAMIWRISEVQGRERSALAVLGFLLVNATTRGAMTSGFFFDQLDYLPILLMLGALYFVQKERPVAVGVLCALGFATKLFPVLVFPVALVAFDMRRRLSLAIAFVATCALVFVPWLVFAPSVIRSSLAFTASRDLWETVWTYPRVSFPPIPSPSILSTPCEAEGAPHRALLGAFGAITLMFCVYRQWRSKLEPARALLSMLLTLLIFAKGVSCYFVLWLFGAIFLTYTPRRAFAICALFVVIANVELIGSPEPFVSTYWIAIFARHGLFAWLLVDTLRTQRNRGTSAAIPIN